jgi:MFS family permease
MNDAGDPASRPVARAPSLSHAWRALRHRNFQLYFVGQGVSLIGTWMTRLATSWLVYRMTHSALLLGAVSFAGQIVALAFGPVAGAWIERIDRRALLVWTQAAAAAQSLAMAALTLTHTITLPEIFALAAFQGLIAAFDMPARQSFLVQMVDDPHDLGNAIAVNSSVVNATRLVGPAIAGAVIAAYGVGWCFLVDGISYFAVIASLAMMRLRPLTQASAIGPLFAQIREGWDYVRGFPPVRTVLTLFFFQGLVGWPYMVLLPVFAARVLHGDAHTLGALSAASGFGALLSALALAMRRSVVGLTRTLRSATVLLGAGLLLFGLSHSLWLSLATMVLAGFGLMQSAAVCNTIIQSLVPDGMRGRVMSYYTMAFFGAAPFGSLLAGALSDHIGAPLTVAACGVACLAGALWYSRELPRIGAIIAPIYRAKGLPVPPKGF